MHVEAAPALSTSSLATASNYKKIIQYQKIDAQTTWIFPVMYISKSLLPSDGLEIEKIGS